MAVEIVDYAGPVCLVIRWLDSGWGVVGLWWLIHFFGPDHEEHLAAVKIDNKPGL